MKQSKLLHLFLLVMLLATGMNAEAQTITLQRLQPYGWQNADNGKEFNLGTVNINTPKTDEGFRVNFTDLTAEDISVTLEGSENFSLTTTAEETDVLISITFQSATEVTNDATTMTVSAPSCEPLTFTVKATAMDLNCTTLATLKEKAAEVNSYSIVLNYTGEALVNAINNGFVYLSDETDEAIVAASGDLSELYPGQYVKFSCTGSTSFQYKWANFNQGQFTKLDKFELPLRHVVESVNDDDYGKFVLLKGAQVTASSHEKTEFAGIVISEYTSYTLTGADGTTYTGTISNSDSPYFAEALPYQDGTLVDIVGVVHPQSSGMGMPSVTVVPMEVRPSVPEVTLPVGEWAGVGHNIMYDYEGETWTVEVTQDENDPYRYHFSYLVPSYKGIKPACYADLSVDGSTLTFPTGWGEGCGGNFFANLGQSTNASMDVQPKGLPVVADVDMENAKFVVRDAVGLAAFQDNLAQFGQEICDMLGLPYTSWSLSAGEEAGATFSYVYPLPTVTDLAVVVEEDVAKLSWTAVEPYPGQEILGYRVYSNGDVVGETDECTYEQENLREGEYTYYVTVLVNDQESEKSNEVTVQVATVAAPTITLQRLQPYGWQNADNGKEFNLGTVNINTPKTDEGFRVNFTDLTAEDVSVTLEGSENFSLTTTAEETDVLISITFQSATEVTDDATTMTVSATGCEPLTFTVKATAIDLNCTTLAALKEKAAEVNSYSIVLNYTGEALVNAVNNGYVYLSDESDEAIVAATGDLTNLRPGQYVKFSCTGSTSFQYKWANFNQGQFTKLDKFELPLRHVVESVNDDDYGKFVLLKGAQVTASSHEKTEFAGIVISEYTSYTLTGADGTTYIGTISNSDSPYFAEALPYQDGTLVDIVGVVHPQSSGMGMPSVTVVPLEVRPSVPEVTLPVGEWAGIGTNNIYNVDGEEWTVEVTQDEEDPYRYHFSYLIPSYKGIKPACYADLSVDGSTLTFPTGWSEGCAEFFFANVSQMIGEDGRPDMEKRGIPLVADVDLELNKLEFHDTIGLLEYIDFVAMFGSEEMCDQLGLPYNTWGSGASESNVVLTYIYPLPTVTDLSVIVEDGIAKLSWSAPQPYPGQEILGYRIYSNGDVVGETDECSYEQDNLRDGEYTYYVTVLVNEEESAPSNEVTIQYVEEVVTGIANVDGSADDDTFYTNLSGIRTKANKRGVYITTVNGKSKKVIVK